MQLSEQYVGVVSMKMNDYIKNLVKANNLISEDILNNDSFSEDELQVVRKKYEQLIEQLQFWMAQNNSKRFCYELKKHVQWMIENYS